MVAYGDAASPGQKFGARSYAAMLANRDALGRYLLAAGDKHRIVLYLRMGVYGNIGAGYSGMPAYDCVLGDMAYQTKPSQAIFPGALDMPEVMIRKSGQQIK